MEAAGKLLWPAVRVAFLALEARIAELERRLGLNSTNSSLPPSRDLPGIKRARKPPSGRRPGAQAGHADRQRTLLPPERRQLCWAHLRRDFLAWQERGKAAEPLGRWVVAETDRLFWLWHRFRTGEFSRSELQRRMRPLQARFTRLLYQAFFCGDAKIERMADQLLGSWVSLWSFLVHEQVEPTNNDAERALRAGVIWRKTSFGSRSEEGLRLVERLLTVAETAKKQQLNLLGYLTQAVTAYRLPQPPPTLLAIA